MKGITPVIAIILLLLITISITGFAFVWFSRMTSDVGEEMGTMANETITSVNQRVNIEAISVANSIVTVRNTGGATIPYSRVSVYADEVPVTCDWSPPPPGTTTIAPGSVASCDWSPAACTGGTTIKITSPGGTDKGVC